MGADAGFAATIAIREQVLADVQRILYHAGRIGPQLAGTFGGQSANLFLDVPRLSMRAADGNRLRIGLTAWGLLTITPAGQPSETRQVLFTAEVLVPPTARLVTSTSRLAIGLAASTATLESYSVDPYAGGSYSAAAQALIASAAFGGVVQSLVQQQLASAGMAGNGFDVSFLGRIASDPNTTISLVVLDSVMVLGLDAQSAALTTNGDPSALADFTAGNDIAIWTNPAAIPVAYRVIRDRIQTQVAASEATLDSYAISVAEGSLQISGSASATGGSVSFSMDAVPRLYRPSVCEEWDEEYGEHVISCTPSRDELWFDMQNVEVDIDRDWWVVLVEIFGGLLSFGIGTLIVEALVEITRGNTANKFEASDRQSAAARNQAFTLSGTIEPVVRLRIEAYDCHADGIFVALSFRPQWSLPKMQGPQYLAADEALAATLPYSCSLPFDNLPRDPYLRIRWTVRRVDTGEALVIADDRALAATSTSFTSATIPLLATSLFSVECRVYRQLGATSTDFFNGSLSLKVVDRLDRTHPYVRWIHEVYTPDVVVEADGSQTVLGGSIKVRASDLHRTALPGRCRMVSKFSTDRVRPPGPGVTEPVLEYRDALPFPRAQLDARRTLVCDYCFYGGPTRTVALIP